MIDRMVEQIPDWVMAGIALGGAIFGVMQYFSSIKARVRAVEVEMERRKEYIYDLKNLEKEFNKMRGEVVTAINKSEETNVILTKLSEAVEKLSISVTKMDAQLESFERRLEREEDRQP